jgi:hypothetical protein
MMLLEIFRASWPMCGLFRLLWDRQVECVLALPFRHFLCRLVVLPHSPRWIKHVGREAEATAAWSSLGFTNAEAEKERETTQRVVEQTAGREMR